MSFLQKLKARKEPNKKPGGVAAQEEVASKAADAVRAEFSGQVRDATFERIAALGVPQSMLPKPTSSDSNLDSLSGIESVRAQFTEKLTRGNG